MIGLVARRALFVMLVVTLAGLLGPSSIALAVDPPGDQRAGNGTRFGTHGATGTIHTSADHSGIRGSSHRGHQDVALHGGTQGNGGPGDGDDGGGVPAAPPPCPRDVLVINSWTEHVPGFNINVAPGSVQGVSGSQGGIVNFKARFWLDGDFDGHQYHRSGPAAIVHYAPDPITGECGPQSQTDFTVRVHYWPVSYAWDYGDGVKPPPTQCGDLYQQPSSCTFDVRTSDPLIEHDYHRSSVDEVKTVDGNTFRGYLVGVTVVFAMGISEDVDGATVTPLREVAAQAWLYYPVREVESVLTQ